MTVISAFVGSSEAGRENEMRTAETTLSRNFVEKDNRTNGVDVEGESGVQRVVLLFFFLRYMK